LEIKGRGYPFCYGADFVYLCCPTRLNLKGWTNRRAFYLSLPKNSK